MIQLSRLLIQDIFRDVSSKRWKMFKSSTMVLSEHLETTSFNSFMAKMVSRLSILKTCRFHFSRWITSLSSNDLVYSRKMWLTPLRKDTVLKKASWRLLLTTLMTHNSLRSVSLLTKSLSRSKLTERN